MTNDIRHANIGFDQVFSNDLSAAKEQFASRDSAPHLMGLGCIAFLQAALGMEVESISEAIEFLNLAQKKAQKEAKAARNDVQTRSRRFPPGLEYDVMHADSVLLLGLAQALSESYAGYLQCIMSLNSAHSRFSKLYDIAFPDGVDNYATPSSSPGPSRKPSKSEINRSMSLPPVLSSSTTPAPVAPIPSRGWFTRWSSSSKVPSVSSPSTPLEPDGPVEELIIAGAAFGYGLFNLVFSLMPPKLRNLVGVFGFKSDRQLALKSLAVAATRNDAHAVFAGLTLMTYHGAVLLLSGYQADEARLLKQYRAIVDKLKHKYPLGSLWILNSAKISSLSGNPDQAITILKEGLSTERVHNFPQADALLVFELAWTLFGQRKYQEAAEMFIRMTEVNTWSHSTYYYIAAGCFISIGNYKKAQELLDQVPSLMEKRRLAGRELPTEVLIKKKLAFYKAKQMRLKGSENNYAECIHLSIADELGLLWNAHHRVSVETAQAHIQTWANLSPKVDIQTLRTSQSKETHNLDTPDELALRSLLLGVVHKSLAQFTTARTFLQDVAKYDVESKWYKVLALFELSVLGLLETEERVKAWSPGSDDQKNLWTKALRDAESLLKEAADISATIEVSSRIESRMAMLRDEIVLKRKMVLGN